MCLFSRLNRSLVPDAEESVRLARVRNSLLLPSPFITRKMELPALPPNASTSSSNHGDLSSLTSEDLSYFSHPKPFKNPHYDRKTTGTISSKRNKTLKQILVLERERIDRVLEMKKLSVLGPPPEQGEGMQLDGQQEEEMLTEEEREKRRKKREEQELELMKAFSDVVSYSSVEAPPSLLPPKKYCDVTGLEAKYVDPKSTLRYHNPEIYELVKSFQPAVIQAYLGVRGQGVVLR
ncbi:Ies6p [Sporobolomyces salmoneus]|uniref:Ies6p n=1 Tax=Sporobolomyces salmoneus TaxID=183962 RepID=UPI0031773F5A